MGGIFGGNMFDMLFIAAADIAYRQGSIYHTVSARPYFLMALSILMTVVLLLGMLRRERHGIANIGFESAMVLVLYLGGVAAIVVSGIG
jgi:cation:H+ antiporter